MEKNTISLSIKTFHLIKNRAELSGRTFEDELAHGIMMYFDPDYANQEIQKLICGLKDRDEEVIGIEGNPLDSVLVSDDLMYRALTKIEKLTERMKSFSCCAF